MQSIQDSKLWLSGWSNMKLIQKVLTKHGISHAVESAMVKRRTRSPPVRTLGLDINTNSTGYVVLSQTGQVDTFGHISTKHLQSDGQILDIGVAIADRLIQVKQEGGSNVSWEVGIEDFLRTFARGQFHTKGLFQLAQLNGLVSYCALTSFGAKPLHVHPTSARNFFSLKTPAATTNGTARKKDAIKHVVMAHFQSKEPQLNLDVIPGPARLDIADAYVIASYTWWQAIVDHVVSDESWQNEELWHEMETKVAKQIAKSSDKETYMTTLFRNEVEQFVRDNHQDHI
ncbi:hypothetical protein LEN26_017083 [Aphanomyces euteiches]|nr:hypothetical protein LEN26_017083 [Aphanomyces euteiches]KAH9114091.1 hypothetical protein AeMF1_011797 [Aphanomyces euteiches]KAH9191751.1 hypothetical protein AeNC1_006268 [Aphanomyces euteiches]